MKTSFLFSVAFGIVNFVAVWVLWSVIDGSGAIDQVQSALNALVGNPDGTGTLNLRQWLNQWRVLGLTALVSVADVIILTALATLMSFLYNLASTVVGGLEVTLAED